ncbi:MAG TPA: RNA polymerase sigma factor [Gemmatimonadales bacterium]|nr:RNA polymerase sigma factor [Gemmatimonadales bacterium]
MDERDLISRVRAGDAGAERALYDAHVDRVYRLAYRLAGNDDRARDFTQETFIRVFDRLETFRGDSALSTWIYAIAHSVILNGLRREKRFRIETDLDHGTQVAGGGRHAEPDLKTRLVEAIDALPEKYRVPFVMHEVEGFTHEEIAAVQGIEVGTSKAQVSRAKAKLRETLAQFAGEWMT